MQILLVRHGPAGSKHSWTGDDQFRPLDDRGRAAARGLVATLQPYAPSRIISSPFLRCLQTVEPLAMTLGLSVEQSGKLVPDSGKRVARLVRGLDEDEAAVVVVCTHGEVIEKLQFQLEGRGHLFGLRRSREKGSVWVLERSGRKFTNAKYIPPH